MAPYYPELAQGPDGETTVWRKTTDGKKLRLTFWPSDGGNGTIFLFPGRSEYIEKYGRVAAELTAAGHPVLTIDWRGQGLSDRLTEDPSLGHVDRFLDYQLDVDCLLAWAKDISAPRPWLLLAHSMGGCIGLRALIDGAAMERAVFSAPMWGIQMPKAFRPLTHVLPPMARAVRSQNRYAPTSKPTSYLAETAFDDNALTQAPATYAWMVEHARAVPEFALGGPSIQWVGEATTEMNALARLPRPGVPALTFLGTLETIVSTLAIQQMHEEWSSAELRIIDGAKHELMMEKDPERRRFMKESLTFFAKSIRP